MAIVAEELGPVPLDEIMVGALCREVRDGDLVAVGLSTPSAVIAALLARESHAPDIAITYCGSVSVDLHDVGMGTVEQAMLGRLCSGFIPHLETLELAERGGMHLEFMAPAQVDGEGNMNTSFVNRKGKAPIHLPGGVATGDVAIHMGRMVICKGEHSPRVFPERVDFITGVGHRDGGRWREMHGIRGRGPTAIVSSMAVMRFRPGEPVLLESVHPGVEVDQVVAATGFKLDVPEHVPVTEPPTREQIKLLREVIDPHGTRRLDLKETRTAAVAALQELRHRTGK